MIKNDLSQQMLMLYIDFSGLASYYCRYICQFADRASPLHNLTKKSVIYNRTIEYVNAFATLKEKLTTSPAFVYPRFNYSTSEFVLQTDASDVGLGAVVEQDGHVVEYSSRSLTKYENNYCVIQKECLSAVNAKK